MGDAGERHAWVAWRRAVIGRPDIGERVGEWQLTEEVMKKDYVLGWRFGASAATPRSLTIGQQAINAAEASEDPRAGFVPSARVADIQSPSWRSGLPRGAVPVEGSGAPVLYCQVPTPLHAGAV